MMSTTSASLEWPPIYRQFLAGGRERFRLTRVSIVLLFLHAAVLAVAVPAICGWANCPMGPLWPWLLLVAMLQALLVAALAARWLGSRAGLLAGLVQMTAASLLPGPAALPDALFCLVFSVALGAFLVAQVPGSPPLADRPALRILFFVAAVIACMLAGPVSMALIFAVCVCYLALSQDRRGSQFLYDRVGLGIFGLVAVAWLITVRWVGWSSAGLVDWACFQTLAGRNGLGAAAPAWGMAALRLSVFAPLALPAICSGLRNGHYATPFWRFLACWSLGPLVLLTVGRFRFDLHIGALLPPLAIVSAVGLESLLRSAWRSRRC